jgi:hypothetical protein
MMMGILKPNEEQLTQAVKAISDKAYEDLMIKAWKELDEKLKLQNEEFNKNLQQQAPMLKEFIKAEIKEQLENVKKVN